MVIRTIKKLYDIDPKSWEHPADRAALSALRQLRGIDALVQQLVSATTERSMELLHAASSVRVTSRQYPRVNRLLEEVADVFDWPVVPTLFITQSPFFNAHTFGVKNPFIVLNTSIVKAFDEDELKVVIAHEMGHVMSGHALYKTLSWMLANLSLSIIPMAEVLVIPIRAAIAEWDRKSELTADRAALLALQDTRPNYNVLMRMAGGDDLSQVHVDEFFLQAQEYERKKEVLDSVHKLLNQIWESHPYPVVRLQELKTWSMSAAYASIVDGNYMHRSGAIDNAQEDIQQGYEYYKSTLQSSDDPIANFVSNVGSGIEKAASTIGDTLKDFLEKK